MLEQLIPNVMVKIPKLIQSILETFQMMGWSGSISFVLGLFFGVVLIVTRSIGFLIKLSTSCVRFRLSS